MAKTWRLINSGPGDAAANMATDEALLVSYRPGVSVPTLRLYEWRPASFSIGFSQDPDSLILSGNAVRRPTGGGLLWHDDELTYGFVADTQDLGLTARVKESYAFVTAFILKTLEILGLKAGFAKNARAPRTPPGRTLRGPLRGRTLRGPLRGRTLQRPPGRTLRGPADFCFSRHEEHDVCLNGKKIGGSAQKRRRRTFLQHGSLPLTLDKTYLRTACRGVTTTDTEGVTSLAEAAGRAFSREEVRRALIEAFVRHFGVRLNEDTLTKEEIGLAERLKTTKYAQASWNAKHPVEMASRPGGGRTRSRSHPDRGDAPLRRPAWLRKKIEFASCEATRRVLAAHRLNTVCREAHCPNIAECFAHKHATFLILGRYCTRHCRFCHVDKTHKPGAPDPGEPQRLARATAELGLAHVVITSVTRDDLPDGGAAHFAAVVRCLRAACPGVRVELLIPDVNGDEASLGTICEAGPDILGHNLETVARLYALRPEADYDRSVSVLRRCKKRAPKVRTKSALMLGLGEKKDEVLDVFDDLRGAGCDYLALGQYLQPSRAHEPVRAYITPEEFDEYRHEALRRGFLHVESGPYVRSSYRAHAYEKLLL